MFGNVAVGCAFKDSDWDHFLALQGPLIMLFVLVFWFFFFSYFSINLLRLKLWCSWVSALHIQVSVEMVSLLLEAELGGGDLPLEQETACVIRVSSDLSLRNSPLVP